MTDNLVVVFLNGGVYQNHVAPPDVQVKIITYDDVENNGECLICDGKLDGFYCAACKIDWDDVTDEEVLAVLRAPQAGRARVGES